MPWLTEEWAADQNADADVRLETQLLERGEWMCRITGYSPTDSHAEPGWAVEMAWQEACDIGAAFRQDAIYFVTGDHLWVSFCDVRRALVSVGSFRNRLNSSVPQHS
jgi:hypothetical protein